MNAVPRQPSRAKAIGMTLILVGVVAYGLWVVWTSTRINQPVDIPIKMAVGHVSTPSFKINQNASFDIQIEVQKKIPFDTLNCLLGVAMKPTSTDLQECPDKPSVVKASWVLISDGQNVAHGSSEDHRYGAWMNDSIARELGSFQGESGRSYTLVLDVLADGSELGPGDPHLKIEVSSAVYEDEMVSGALVTLVSILLVLVGGITLLVSFVRNRRGRVNTVPDLLAASRIQPEPAIEGVTVEFRGSS
jgi:hypothetical protein